MQITEASHKTELPGSGIGNLNILGNIWSIAVFAPVAQQNRQNIPKPFQSIKTGVWVAETKGFEPSRPFRAYSLSRGAPSTTRPRLRRRVYPRKRMGHKR